MGAVYLVEQISTGKQRALKLMLPQLVTDAVLRKRFEQEARVGALIESEHVVEVVGAGVDAATNMPWLAMELLNGDDLSHVMTQRGLLRASDVLAVFEQLCHAVGAAHRAGIVHRDLKPENIFLARSRRAGAEFTVKVLDFGIAKVVAEAKATRTAAIGSPVWMSPEQTDRSAITPATDVWALGLIAFHLMTGRFFWTSANGDEVTIPQLLREILFEAIPPASQRASELRSSVALPAGFDEWFSRCVAREPSARFQEAHETFAQLRRILVNPAAPPLPSRRPTPPQAPSAPGIPPKRLTVVTVDEPSPVQRPAIERTAVASAQTLADARVASGESAARRSGPAQIARTQPAPKAPPPLVLRVPVIVGLVVAVALIVGFIGYRSRSAPSSASADEALAAPRPAAPAPAPMTSVPPSIALPVPTATAEPTAATSVAVVPASASARPESKKPPTPNRASLPAAAQTDAPFDKAATIAALGAAAASAAGCKTPDGPTGSGKATVTFAPSGRVTTASVTAPFAGTDVGACVARSFRAARVPPFAGEPVTVSKSISIN